LRSPVVSLEFFFELIIRPYCCLGVDSVANRNEYQKYFLGGRGGRRIRLTTLPRADCLEIWEPRPLGTLWVCYRPVQGWLYLHLHLY
jgi:hypothetical protein